jgi:hypothetical protein
MCFLTVVSNSAPVNRSWGPVQVASLERRVRVTAAWRIHKVLREPGGLPNGKGGRKKLSQSERRAFKTALLQAVGHAGVWAEHGPLPNRVPGRGRPPDNAVFVFIDDVVRACEAAGLKAGLRYVAGSESLPVRLYQELAPLLWGLSKDPRRLFERWQRLRQSLVRG